MEFNINKDATLPILKLELIKDGRNEFRHFFDKVEDSTLSFTMTDLSSGIIKIGKATAIYQEVQPSSDCVGVEYYLTYQFNKKQTSIAGRYVGKFEITFNDGSGTLIVPIKENLYINILDSGIKK